MNNFNIGDIVLFSCKPNYVTWRKGKIVANNFSTCNLPYFFGKPVYYISEVDDNDNVIDYRKSVAIDKDSEYILKFLPGMEAMIGKSTCVKNIYTIDIEKEFPEQVADVDYIRWKNQFKNVSKDDYLDIPGLKEMFDEEQKWKEKIEKKLDDINDKLNKLLLYQRTWTDPYPTDPCPTYPWTPGTPSNPWYDTNKDKVYCDKDKMKITHVYTSNITPEEAYKYQKRYYSNSTDVDFDYKKYNDMCCNKKMESTMFGNEVLDDKYDTCGLDAASKKINNNNQNKK